MLSEAARRFAALPTAAKFLLILTAALLPIGVGLVWAASQGIRDANNVLRAQAEEQAHLATQGVESLIARNALALRIAANGRIGDSETACSNIQQSLTVTPAVAQRFELEDANGQRLCEVGTVPDTRVLPLVAPGDIALRILPERGDTCLPCGRGRRNGDRRPCSKADLRQAALGAAPNVDGLFFAMATMSCRSFRPAPSDPAKISMTRWPVANGRLEMHVGTKVPEITTGDRLLLLLPFLMWLVAALLAWVLVNRLFIRPLRQLQRRSCDTNPAIPNSPCREPWVRRRRSRSCAMPSQGRSRGSRSRSRAWPARSKGKGASSAKSTIA